MKRLSKVILFIAASFLLLVIAAFIGLGIYLKTPRAQTQIQEAVGDALGTPIRIAGTSLSLLGNLEINGITVPAPEGAAGDFITARKFTAECHLLPLTVGTLVVPKMVLHEPVMVWPQNQEGRWVWPESAKKKTDEPKKKGVKGESESGFEVVIRALEIQNGRITLLGRDGKPMIAGEGVTVKFNRLEADDLAGDLTVARLNWAGILPAENLSTSFTYYESALSMPELQATVAGGALAGSFKLAPEEDGAPMSIDLAFENVGLGLLAAANGWAQRGVAGSLFGKVRVSGDSREFARAEGRGSLEVKDAQFDNLDIFQTIGQVLAIEELANLRLDEARASVRIADEKAFVESLVLASPNLRISAEGVARFDKKLKLDATLAIGPKLAGRLPGFVLANFSGPDAESMRAIEFGVGGDIDKPKTDIAEKLIGKKIGNQVTDLISGLFGGRKDKDDDKKKREEKRKKEEKKKEEAAEEAAPAADTAPSGDNAGTGSKIEPVPPVPDP